jgi:serine/threonine protein kinase
VHRDIKPENILVDDVKGMKILKIGDFGICKFDLQVPNNTTLNKSTTPAYRAPEVYKGSYPTV